MKKIVGFILSATLVVPSLAFASVGITLTGGDVVVTAGKTFVEPGYSAFSSYDGDITNSVTVSGVNTTVVGSHTVNYSVTDSNSDSAYASRNLTVVGGGNGGQIYCSSPTAPGWNVSLPDGGCGGGSTYIPFGKLFVNNLGYMETCSFRFGCMIK